MLSMSEGTRYNWEMPEHFYRVAYCLSQTAKVEHRSCIRHKSALGANGEISSVRSTFPNAEIWLQEVVIDDPPTTNWIDPSTATPIKNYKPIKQKPE